MSAVNMFMRYAENRESRAAEAPEDLSRDVTLHLHQSDLETLRGVLEIFRAEWSTSLAKSIMQDDLTGIATAEAVLRKVDPLLKSLG